MKRQVLTKRMIAGFVTGFLASIMMGLDQDMEEVSFDTLFPQSWYAKALTAVTHVWGDLEALSTQPLDQREQGWIVDASMGRMAFCAYALTHLHEVQKISVSDDDLCYLKRAVKSIEERSERLSIQDQDRLHCLQRMIIGVKKRIKFLLQANDSRACPCE